MVEVTNGNLHAAKLALESGRASGVRAGVELAGGPSLVQAGRVVQRLGFTVSVPGPLTWEHAMFSTALHRVASDPSIRHLVHVWYTVVHHGEPQLTTIKKNIGQIYKLFQKNQKNQNLS